MSKIYRGEMQDNLGNTIYPHTEAGLVYCADGETIQQKIADMAETLDGITGVSDSTELDDSTKLATSKAVKTLKDSVNGSLESNNEHFYYDVQNGVRGFNTDPARGADTFYPFSSGKAYRITVVAKGGAWHPAGWFAAAVVETTTVITIHKDGTSSHTGGSRTLSSAVIDTNVENQKGVVQITSIKVEEIEE